MSRRHPLGKTPVRPPEGFPGRVGFVKSASRIGEAPSSELPEVAVCGRSNVGKSSLLNVLCNRRQLARVSSTPGRTRLINFFAVQDLLMLVDLPGYGYAKGPLEERERWGETIAGYLRDRPQLRLSLLLVDARRGPEEEERNLLAWFQQTGRPCLAVLTKCDKLGRSDIGAARKQTASLLEMPLEDVVVFSALARTGREDLWATILAACEVDPRRPADDVGDAEREDDAK
ncbi:MAG: YihA family ribosome biogenesis GTP-binding protein [Deltaproteobacteria bacterium]|nr:YihA family ribosome biogenesis GTP-binding protein [Deltaproteobacteria bacterium]